MRGFVRDRHAGKPLWDCGQSSAGNGALMRVAAVPAFHLMRPSGSLLPDALLASALTHNDPTSNAACVAFAVMLCELAGMRTAPEPEWWVGRFVQLARPLEGHVRLRSRVPNSKFAGGLCEFLEAEVTEALRKQVPALEAMEAWHSGAFLLETVPCALLLLATHADSPEAALVRAVNDTRDNDTVAAIVGAAVGALHGEQALPSRWRDNLLGRTMADDDGHLFKLLDRLTSPGGVRERVQDPNARGLAG